MTKVYQIEQLKMIRDLNEFTRTEKTSAFLSKYLAKNGITKKNFYNFCDGMSREETKELYSKLVKVFQKQSQNNTEIDLQLRYDIEDAYFIVTNNLLTKNNIYSFPSVIKKYRKDINPVRALYFEVAELNINFSKDDYDAEYIKQQFQNQEWYEKLMYSIENDLESLKKIEAKYSKLKKQYKFFTLPLSYYHTQEMISDMQKWLNVFTKFYRKANKINFKYD